MANEHLFQISSIKLIESSKKKIAPEIHLMTKQKELICLVGIAFIRLYVIRLIFSFSTERERLGGGASVEEGYCTGQTLERLPNFREMKTSFFAIQHPL